MCNRPIDLFHRENGCPNCSVKSKSQKRKTSQKDFEEKLFLQNPKILVVGKYKGSHELVECKCLICNYIWESYACNLLNGSTGCPKCNMSVGENKIVDFMEKHQISYTRQKSFVDCKDKYPLKFDVYDEDNNIVIEFQGEQHYFPVDFETNNYQKAQEQFNSLIRRDNIKKEYCLNIIFISYAFLIMKETM